MIWFRRIIAIPLALVFILLFVFLLVVQRINATAGNPDFYIEQLRQADIYNFMYHDIVPAALEEIEIDTSEVPIDIERLKSDVPGMIEEALPPEWLQTQMEQVISQVLPYILGDTGSFSVRIPLKDQVEATAGAVKDILHDEDIFPDLYEQGIDFAVDKYAEMQEDLPSFLVMSEDEAASRLRTVLPADWIITQIDTNIDEFVPYITKDKEQFLLKLDVSERMDALEAALTDILMKPETYDYMLNELLVPYIQEKIKGMGLPAELTFTDNEIIAVVEKVLPADWYEARVTDIVGQVFSYLNGTTATINIIVPLADLKPAAIEALADLADRKLESLVNSLPVGTPEQIEELEANPPIGSLPPYRPADMSYTELKELLGIDIESLVASSVDEWIPDQFVLTDAGIREELAKDGDEDLLTQARDLVQDGLTYTDADLRKDMGADYDNIEDIRQWIASDFTFTEEDLHEWITKTEGGNADEQWQTLQDVRSVIGPVRDWVWAAWLIPALLLVGIGFLGGRGWQSRVVWGASVLAIAALITYIVFGPVFSAVAKPSIDDAIVSAVGTTEGVGALAADKGITVAKDTVDSFVGGINIQAIVLLVVSLAVIAVVVFWHPWRRRSKSTPEPAPPGDLPPTDQTQDPPD
jgi:hypothetical protein